MPKELYCPLCCEEIDETHIYKHFKYKKFACGESDCDAMFYTTQERNAHCDKKSHKRSFQQTINPYLDFICEMIEKDAELLKKFSINKIVEGRVSGFYEVNDVLEGANGENGENDESESESVPSSSAKKKKSKKRVGSEIENGKSPKKTKNGKTTKSSSDKSPQKEREKEKEKRPQKTATAERESRVAAPAPSLRRSAGQGSTSSLSALTPNSSTNSFQARKENPPVQHISKYHRLNQIVSGGWYDPNNPDREDNTKVECGLCRKEISYDYLDRKDHVGRCHISADVSAEEYEDIMKSMLDTAFPELPNTDLACQLCMGGKDIRAPTRREHIENKHFLPILECPFDDCKLVYRRQCDMSSHLKDSHRSALNKITNKTWQMERRRRNAMINEMINKCFPMAKYDILKKAVRPQDQSIIDQTLKRVEELNKSALDNAFTKDIRVQEMSKTRRAPIYNRQSSSSSSSSDEDSNLPTTSTRHKRTSRVSDRASTASGDLDEADGHLSEDDVIFIREQFNHEISQKLKQRLVGMSIKSEGADWMISREPEEVEEAPMEIEQVHVPSAPSTIEITDEVRMDEDVKNEAEEPETKVEPVEVASSIVAAPPRSPIREKSPSRPNHTRFVDSAEREMSPRNYQRERSPRRHNGRSSRFSQNRDDSYDRNSRARSGYRSRERHRSIRGSWRGSAFRPGPRNDWNRNDYERGSDYNRFAQRRGPSHEYSRSSRN